MAKKSAIDQFLAEVLDTIPEDRRQLFEETLKDEKVSRAVTERVLARSDYSSKMDALKSEREQMDAYLRGENQKIQGWAQWYEGVVQTDAERQKQLDAYKSTFGDLDPANAKPGQKFMTEDQYRASIAKELEQRDQNAIRFADILTDLKYEHRTEFGQRLDTDDLIKYATSQGLPIQAAYDRYVGKARAEKQETELAKKLDAAREEGRKEALSNHKLPYSSGPVEPHVLDLQKDIAKAPRDRVAAAVADWNGTDHKSFY